MDGPKLKNALVLFSKAPIAGMVKTRLQPCISPEKSACLQEAFIKDSILKMRKIDYVDRFLYFQPEERKYLFEKLIGGLPIHLYCQKGLDLGKKMENAFRDLFNKGFSRVVIIGVDSPTLPEKYINKAFTELNTSDLAIGPAVDGGYYLIGLKEKLSPVFSSVEWGSDKVLLQTENLIKKHDIKLSLLPVHYDIDTVDDLHFLKAHLQILSRSGEYIPVNTMRVIEQILS